MSLPHSIQQHSFDLEVEDKAQAQRLHQALSEAFSTQFVPLLAAIMDEFVGPEETVKLGRIELDLGQCTEAELLPSLLRQLPQALRLALSGRLLSLRQLGVPLDPVDHFEPSTSTQVDYLAHYLIHGRWPAAAPDARLTLVGMLESLLRQPPPNLVARLWELLGQPSARQRLAQALSPPLLARVLDLLHAYRTKPDPLHRLDHLLLQASVGGGDQPLPTQWTDWQRLPDELLPAVFDAAMRRLTGRSRTLAAAWLDRLGTRAFWDLLNLRFPQQRALWAQLAREWGTAELAPLQRTVQVALLHYLSKQGTSRTSLPIEDVQTALRKTLSDDTLDWDIWLAKARQAYQVPALRQALRDDTLDWETWLAQVRRAYQVPPSTQLPSSPDSQSLALEDGPLDWETWLTQARRVSPSAQGMPPPDAQGLAFTDDALDWETWLAQARQVLPSGQALPKPPSAPQGLAHPPHTKAALDLVFHWLVAGELPWWTATDQRPGAELLREVITQQPQALRALWEELRATLSSTQKAALAQRLADLPPTSQQVLLLHLIPDWGGFVLTLWLAGEWVTQERLFRVGVWETLLVQALTALSPAAMMTQIIARWQGQGGADFPAQLARLRETLVERIAQAQQQRFRPLLSLLDHSVAEQPAPPLAMRDEVAEYLETPIEPTVLLQPATDTPSWEVLAHAMRLAALPRGYTGLSPQILAAWFRHFAMQRPAQVRALLRDHQGPRRRAMLLRWLGLNELRQLFDLFDAEVWRGFFEATWAVLGQAEAELDAWLQGHALHLLLRPGHPPPNLIAYLRDLSTYTARVSGQSALSLVQHWGEMATKQGGTAALALLPTLRVMAEGLQRDSPSQIKPLPREGGQTPDTATAAPKREPDTVRIEAPIYVINAGLVLLWPFWDFYFQQLELLDEDKQFRDLASQQRAVLLLQYLATGREETEESHLPLNKILCNLPVDDPLPLTLVLTEAERELSNKLFGALKGRWPGAKDLGPDGIRGSFLLREGRLLFKGKTWNLRVDQKPYDLLLNSLPYSLSLVRLPWRKTPLHVEWR